MGGEVNGRCIVKQTWSALYRGIFGLDCALQVNECPKLLSSHAQLNIGVSVSFIAMVRLHLVG